MNVTINLENQYQVHVQKEIPNVKIMMLKGDKGDQGQAGTVEFDELTPEQIAMLKGDPGDDYVLTQADKEEIAAIVEDETDTDWVNLGSYLDTTKVTEDSNNPVQARRIGNIVFYRGQVSLVSAVDNKGDIACFTTVPEQFRPPSGDPVARIAVAWNDGLWRFSVSSEGWTALKNLTGAQEASGKSGKIDCTFCVG